MNKWLSVLVISFSVVVQAQEYKLLNRTYINLAAIDLTQCKNAFRFINDNWMDCEQNIPLPDTTALAQITRTTYEFFNFTYPISGTDFELYFDVRTSGRDSMDEKFILTAYYRKVGSMRIEYLSADHYSSEIFFEYLLKSFDRISQSRGFKSERPLISIPAPVGNKMVEEVILDSVHVARRNIRLILQDCQQRFAPELIDAWPEQDYWITECRVINFPAQSSVPFDPSVWASELLPAQTVTAFEQDASLSYTSAGYTVSFNGNKKWSEVEATVSALFKKAGFHVDSYFIVKGSELGSLSVGDEVLGKLVRRNSLMGIDPVP